MRFLVLRRILAAGLRYGGVLAAYGVRVEAPSGGGHVQAGGGFVRVPEGGFFNGPVGPSARGRGGVMRYGGATGLR